MEEGGAEEKEEGGIRCRRRRKSFRVPAFVETGPTAGHVASPRAVALSLALTLRAADLAATRALNPSGMVHASVRVTGGHGLRSRHRRPSYGLLMGRFV